MVFLGKTLYSHSASLPPGVQMCMSKFIGGCNPVIDLHPIKGGVEIFLVALCYRNQDTVSSGLMGHIAHVQSFVFSSPCLL